MTRPAIRPAILCVLAWGLTGCPSPSIYGTARTTPVGKASHSLSAEGLATWDEQVIDDGTMRTVRRHLQPVPSLPTYMVRVGVTESTDVGFRLAHGALLGADLKQTILKSEFIDLALDPMLQVGYSPGGWGSREEGILYAHAPAIVDLNLSESVTLVMTPGALYASPTNATDFGGYFARMGLGINLRLSKGFALQPEVTVLSLLGTGETPLLITGSVGFLFGALPEQGDPEDVAAP